MTTLYLARHGETDWNQRGKLQGHTDIPLNDVGRQQAHGLASRLSGLGITKVTTSDLSRARETGVVVAQTLAVAPPTLDPELRERCFGVFEGLTRDECATLHPEAWKAWLEHTTPPEGGEVPEAAIMRMTSALSRALAHARASEATLVVSHGGVMRLWLQRVMGTKLPLIANGSVYVVTREGEGEGATLHASRWSDLDGDVGR